MSNKNHSFYCIRLAWNTPSYTKNSTCHQDIFLKKRTGITFFNDDFAVCRKQNPEYYVSPKYGDEPISMIIMKLDENVRM